MIDTGLISHQMQQLLEDIGPGWMLSTAYDTAWIARLSDRDPELGARALEWLRANQLPDGSWGAPSPRYHHDRLICTLAAMTALAKYGNEQDYQRCQRAQLALRPIANGLLADPPGATAGFEMIAPTLLKEAHDLNLVGDWHNDVLDNLTRYRQAKLAMLPGGMISRAVTVAYSTEMVGPDGLHLLDVDHLQEANGSVGHSPSATAFFALHVRPDDPAAMNYLRNATTDSGGMPVIWPFDVFEPAWTLWNFSLLDEQNNTLIELSQRHLDFLENAWDPTIGIGQAAGFTPKDGDDTGLIYEVLKAYGRAVNPEPIFYYEEDDYYRCFALESNPSISTNVHILSALRAAGLPKEHPSVQKVISFLQRTQTIRLFWFDKWHSSPYYPTAHLIIASAGYADELVDNAVYWTIETQNQDGSWGYYMPTAEETAYCLQALTIWKRSGHPVPDDVLQRGAAWLQHHMDHPLPPLWIGKCLYVPVYVVRSAILSALMLVAQG
ncbi:MAG: cyclase [Anaerolineae bacterium]|nr:cyclase [Anaerolineae bacterium]